jgi:hypothetical protein
MIEYKHFAGNISLGTFIFSSSTVSVMHVCFLSHTLCSPVSLRDLFLILSDSMSTDIITCYSRISSKSQTALDLGNSVSRILTCYTFQALCKRQSRARMSKHKEIMSFFHALLVLSTLFLRQVHTQQISAHSAAVC